MGAACSSENSAQPVDQKSQDRPQEKPSEGDKSDKLQDKAEKTPENQPNPLPADETPAPQYAKEDKQSEASSQLSLQNTEKRPLGTTTPIQIKAEVTAEAEPAPVLVADTHQHLVESAKTSGLSWRDMLTSLSKEDPWGGGPRREDRPYWRGLLEEAQALVRTPRRTLPQDVTLAALRGDPSTGDQSSMTDRQSRVTIFVSSTFTDTQAERNMLMRDVYPYVRKLCRYLDLDFGTVDMRWGVKEELTMEHGTTQMCISEVQRCLRESAGPAFMAILGHKYGYRTLPVEIDQSEFEKLMGLLESEDTTIIRDFYALDTNALSPVYVLQPRKADDSDWWNREKKIIALFRKVADQLDPETAEKYFISITEKEVKYGFLDNRLHEEQVICLKRQLNHVTDERHVHRHIIDMKDGAVDANAQKYLTELKNDKIGEKMAGADDVVLDFEYTEDEIDACRQYIVNTCDKVCEQVSRKILEAYKTHHHVEKDLVYDEVVQHKKFALQKTDNFVGREDLIQNITTKITKSLGQESKVLGSYGTSGCGKTSLMAVVAKTVKNSLVPNATIVLRFLGTTGQSGSIRAALYSVCMQLAKVYGKPVINVPRGYSDLITYFQEALNYGTASQPIIIFLDSLDQLSNEDFGQNLKWLCLAQNVPAHASIVVSTIPGSCLDALKAHLPQDQLTQVPNMTSADGPLLLDQMLAAQGRKVTPDQRKILLDAFAKCPLPLFFRLAVDIAIKWHSYDEIAKDEIADDMPGLITTLFEQLESRFGAMFVQHALAYITCARDGLSVGELEDILSCDDEVLDYLFDYWLPPFRRIPQLLWIRVRNELASYLMERGTNGVNAYGWYHRQFWETAAARYLDNQGGLRAQAHEALADYFEGKWSDGKLWTPKKKTRAITDLSPRMEDRQVPRQPLVLSGSRSSGRQLGRRKLAELPHHLLALKDWDRLEQLVTTLPFVEAKFEAGQGYECRSFFLKAADQSGRKSVKAMSKFIGLGLPYFLAEPESIYQVASQQAQGNPVKAMFEEEDKTDMTRHFSWDQKQAFVDDPCEMTLTGHTSGVRCARYNPKGHLIASTAEDGSMRIWDVFSGAEVVTVTGLPGPRYSTLADPYHGERPCTWDREGKVVVTGAEDGTLQVWDTNGAQVLSITPHSSTITGVDVSPDNSVFVSCSRDGSLRAWSMDDYSMKASVSVGQALGCAFSPDGAWVAVSLSGRIGLQMVRVSDWSVQMSGVGAGTANLSLCVAYSPNGQDIVTGGDDSSLTVWSAQNGQAVGVIRGHRGWIWCVHFNKDGSRLLSCSSDRMLKLWDIANRACLVTLGGHQHRVTWACFRPGTEETFVTASLDMTLKVWDYEAVSLGRTPPTGSLHYSVLEVSPSGQYMATCQGWSKMCTLLDMTSGETATSAPHNGSLASGHYTHDSLQFVTVDMGHSGAYEDGSAKNAEAKVSYEGGITTLNISSPSAVGSNKKYIVVGSSDHTVSLFDITSRNKLHSWEAGDSAIGRLACSLSDDIIATSTGYDVKIWSVGPQHQTSLVTTLPHFENLIAHMQFSPNGKHLATGCTDGKIIIWNATDRKFNETCVLTHSARITSLSFSLGEADDFFASSSVDMSMRVWNVMEGFKLHAVFYGPINEVAFLKKNVVAVGESTGNKRHIEFAA